MQQQSDQQSAYAPVAVQEWMNRLELRVGKPGPDQGGHSVVPCVQEPFQISHASGQLRVGRRNVAGVPRSTTPNPVLRPTELARHLGASAPPGQKFAVNLAEQPVAQGKPLVHEFQAVVQGGNIVRDLYDIVERNPRSCVQLKHQEVRDRRLRSLDPRREHGFLANVAVYQ